MKKINDVVYIVYQDHICMCSVKGIYEEDGIIYYELFNHYINKKINFFIHECKVYSDISDLVTEHIKEHR